MRRKFVGYALAGLMCAGSVMVAVPQASAANNLLCNAAGNVFITHSGGKMQLDLQGIGRCSTQTNKGPWIAILDGTGSMEDRGACDDRRLPLVKQLTIKVAMELRSVVSHVTEKYYMLWNLRLDTFPRLSAFAVYDEAGAAGAGTMITSKNACEGTRVSSGAEFDFDFIHDLRLI
jgi:hypothetical protein